MEKWLDIILKELTIEKLAKYFSIHELKTMYVDECMCNDPKDEPNKQRNAKIRKAIEHKTNLDK